MDTEFLSLNLFFYESKEMKNFFKYAVPLCCVAAFCAVAGNASAAGVTYFQGHSDFEIKYEPGELEFKHAFEDGLNEPLSTVEVEFEVGDVVTLVGPAAKEGIGFVDSLFGVLGLSQGDTFWKLPQLGGEADAEGLPFFGIKGKELDAAGFSEVLLSLTGVTHNGGSGTGHFALWQTGFAPVVDSSDGIDGDDEFAILLNDHDHYNWGFTSLGTYEVELTASGFNPTDGFLSTTTILTFSVVPEPSSVAALASLGLVGTFVRRRRS